MTRRPPTDYHPRVWIADVTKRGHGVFHDYRDEWQFETLDSGWLRRFRCVTKICENDWHNADAVLGIIDIPITWAHELGFRACRRCVWPDWIVEKYGEVPA